MSGFLYDIIFPVAFDYTDEYWNKFAAVSPTDPIVTLRCRSRAADRYKVETLDGVNGDRLFCISQGILSIDDSFENGTVYCNPDDTLGIYGCAMVAVYGNLIRKNTLVIHSSLIEHDGCAIMFTGPSGVGKTTQAELWHEHRNSPIINGDMVFVRKESDGRFYAYGSPWHGSSEYCVKKRLPLKAIVAPVQSGQCSISKLDGMDMLRRVFPEVMLPDWFDGCKELGMATLDELLKCTPVYHLECTKNIQAVETVEKELGTLN